jgi:uncharacterized protein
MLQQLWGGSMRRWRSLVIGGLVLFSLLYIQLIEPSWIEIKQVAVTLPHLDRAFENYKIVQMTDIHADRWMTPDRLSKIVQLVNQQQPDLVTLTGDYVTRAAERYAPTLTVLNQLNSPDGAIAVLGNHDQWTNPQVLVETLSRSGIQVLRNQVQAIVRGDATLQVAGVGDVLAGDANLPQVMAQMPPTGTGIMLAHEPDFADRTAATQRFALQLSGHSHGGQVYIPFVKRIVPKLAKNYPAGLYQVDDLWQYTSRGLGMAGLRIRFNCRPEITVLTLHGAKA